MPYDPFGTGGFLGGLRSGVADVISWEKEKRAKQEAEQQQQIRELTLAQLKAAEDERRAATEAFGILGTTMKPPAMNGPQYGPEEYGSRPIAQAPSIPQPEWKAPTTYGEAGLNVRHVAALQKLYPQALQQSGLLDVKTARERAESAAALDPLVKDAANNPQAARMAAVVKDLINAGSPLAGHLIGPMMTAAQQNPQAAAEFAKYYADSLGEVQRATPGIPQDQATALAIKNAITIMGPRLPAEWQNTLKVIDTAIGGANKMPTATPKAGEWVWTPGKGWEQVGGPAPTKPSEQIGEIMRKLREGIPLNDGEKEMWKLYQEGKIPMGTTYNPYGDEAKRVNLERARLALDEARNKYKPLLDRIKNGQATDTEIRTALGNFETDLARAQTEKRQSLLADDATLARIDMSIKFYEQAIKDIQDAQAARNKPAQPVAPGGKQPGRVELLPGQTPNAQSFINQVLGGGK